MSKNTANQNAKDFLNNLIYNVEAIRTQVEHRVYHGNNASKTTSLPKAA